MANQVRFLDQVAVSAFGNTGGTETTNTSSLLLTASAATNVITFTKGDGSTFPVTVDTGSASSAFPFVGNAVITGSLTVSGSDSVVNLQEIQFNTDHSQSGHTTGRMYWDDNDKTVTIDMQGSDVRLQVGQEEHVYAKNTSGVVINNGDAVRISGAVGGNVTIEKAISSIKSFKDITETDQILGLATENIANNQSGYITTFGQVRGLDTTTFTGGDILFLSNTTSGSYSNTKPPSPYFQARIGIVEVVNALEGTILVRPGEPTFLTDISQITASGVITNEKTYLCYDDNTDLISFTNAFSGSFSGSFQGDGSNLTGVATDTGSLMTTASVSLNTITFTKGDGSTFPITVDTGSGGGGGGSSVGTSNEFQLTDNSGGFTSSLIQQSSSNIIPTTTAGSGGVGTRLGSTTNSFFKIHLGGQAASSNPIFGAGIEVQENTDFFIQEEGSPFTTTTMLHITRDTATFPYLTTNRSIQTRNNGTQHFRIGNSGDMIFGADGSNKNYIQNASTKFGFWNTGTGAVLSSKQSWSNSDFDSSVLLNLKSTTQGFSPPTMTGAQVEAISTPTEGLMVYSTSAGAGDVTNKGWWGYNGTNWSNLLSDPPKAFQTLSFGLTSSWDVTNGVNAEVTLTGSGALSVTNAENGDYGTLIIKQDGVGGHTLSLPSDFKVVNGGSGSITLSTGANEEDIISWTYNGTDFYASFGLNFT